MREIPSIKEQLKAGLADLEALNAGKIKLSDLRTTKIDLPDFDADKVKELRKELHVSQGVLAMTLKVSKKTVQAWELGSSLPSGPAQVLLNLLKKKPAIRKELIPS